MQINKSAEDYLESMLILKEEHGYIRSVDIAQHLGVTKPSVSYATKNLRENGYITMASDGLITLTDKGMEIAERIYNRHKILTRDGIQRRILPIVAVDDAQLGGPAYGAVEPVARLDIAEARAVAGFGLAV